MIFLVLVYLLEILKTLSDKTFCKKWAAFISFLENTNFQQKKL